LIIDLPHGDEQQRKICLKWGISSTNCGIFIPDYGKIFLKKINH